MYMIGSVISGSIMAQLNESDTLQFQLRASLTGNYQQGNVEVLTVRGKLDLVYAPTKKFVFKSQNSSLYQAFYSNKADNDIFSRNYFYYQPQKRIYPFAIAYVSSNYRRKIDTRLFTGVGATLQIINKPLSTVKVSVSGVYEETNFKGNTFNYPNLNGQEKISLWRGTLYTGGWNYVFDKHLRFYYDAFWQPSFSDENNYRAQFDIGVDFPVWKGLSLNMLYTFTHENVVIASVKKEDKILTFGLAYNFRKK